MQKYSKMVFYFFIISLVVSPAKNILAQVNEPELPNIFLADVKNRQKVESFVGAFIKVDPQANQLLNPSNVGLFKKGYRGKMGLFNDPESKGGRQADLKKYFTEKTYLDLVGIKNFNQPSLRAFIDKIGKCSDETLICTGTIGRKYNFKFENFVFEDELLKIPDGPEKEKFKNCWLNDSILGTEMRILAWVYFRLFGEYYTASESR